MAAEKHMVKIIGIIFILLVTIGTTSLLMSVVGIDDDFELKVTDYVARGAGLSETKNTASFNEAITFDFEIVESVHEDDVKIFVVDESGDKKLLFQQYYTRQCGDDITISDNALILHPTSLTKMKVTHNEYMITLSEVNSGDTINYVTKNGEFGEGRLHLQFYVYKHRTNNYNVCRNKGLSDYRGIINVQNIIIEDYDIFVDCYQCDEKDLVYQQFLDACPAEWLQEELNCKQDIAKITGNITASVSNYFALKTFTYYLVAGLSMVALIATTVIIRKKKGK